MVAAPAQAALRIEVATEGLSTGERQASAALVAQVLARLPAPLRDGDGDGRVLQLRWRDDLPAQVVGRARGTGLGLDRRLLAALDGTRGKPDPSAWRPAQAALIHELAHALDRSAAGGWSRQPRFLDLAGWQARPLLPGRGRNRFLLRSPDAYELRSPAEFFAVNLEHYLLDADNACRRPALHRWFAATLGPLPAPAPAPACSPALPFVDAGEHEGGAALLELDPARVYAVDYLLAEGNAQPMSRWGHGMLRLVVCAPGRAPGPDCRMDLQHHRVLSFRAFVDDVQLSSWRGLTGDYPSRLFVLPLERVVEDYTRVELRSLASTPLQLQRGEIAALLEQAARVHWTYDGRYYFINNNCAVETWKLLHAAVPRLDARQRPSITPLGLLRRLARDGATGAHPGDRATAIREGYYFESAAPHYRQLFGDLRTALGLPQTTVAQWWALPAAARRRWMDVDDERVLAALLVLEQAAARREERQVREWLKRGLVSPRGDAGGRARVRALLEQTGMLLAPGMLAGEGYGLPSEAERARLRDEVAARAQAAGDDGQALRGELLNRLPQARRLELQDVEVNIARLRRQLRLRYGSGADAAGTEVPARP
nr:DUF4105 domain-containing protein [Stenotrophomonas mori]